MNRCPVSAAKCRDVKLLHLFLLLLLACSLVGHTAAQPPVKPYTPRLKWCQPNPLCKTRSCGPKTDTSCERRTKEGGTVCWDATVKAEPPATTTRVCFEREKCYSYPRSNLRCMTK